MKNTLMSSLVVGLVSIGISIPATFTQFQSTLLAQNNNRLRVVEIGRLSTGERILQVPKELMQQRVYKEALKSPIRPTPTPFPPSNWTLAKPKI